MRREKLVVARVRFAQRKSTALLSGGRRYSTYVLEVQNPRAAAYGTAFPLDDSAAAVFLRAWDEISYR